MAKRGWVNRIIGHAEIDPNELLANPRNWRIHPHAQQEALEGVLEEVGWVDEVIVNQHTGFVVDGHLRAALAIGKDQPLIPVKYVHLTEEEEMMILATLDPLSAMAGQDVDQLNELLAEIEFESDAVNRMLDELSPKQIGEVPEVTDEAEALREKWGTESGQLWTIGKHRLLCGDSTDPNAVKELMDGEKADCLFTDPPYNINMQRSGSIAGDNQTPEEYDRFTNAWQGNAFGILTDECATFVFIGFREYPNMAIKLRRLFDELNCIVWAKPSIGLGGLNGGLRYQHEFIWFGGNKKTNDKSIGDLWDFDRDNTTYHPTLKPAPLIGRALSVIDCNLIYDPFMGSGTTMVAAEQLNRICYGMEIEPKYVAVTLERMSLMGLEPKLG